MPTKAKRVLSLSYDVALRLTRDLLLEREGYKVTSAESFQEASARCMDSRYDLCILGHSIPACDKNELMNLFRANCSAPVLSLQRRGEDKFPNADYYAYADAPDELMQLVATILGKNTLAGA